MPMIHILSHHGILCSFIVINLKQGIPMICSPPEQSINLSGLSFFTTPLRSADIVEPMHQKKPLIPEIKPAMQSSIDSSQNMVSFINLLFELFFKSIKLTKLR